LPRQGTGWDILASPPRTGSSFCCHTLDCPFTDKEIQAYGLKGSTAALGQSAVRRHAWADVIVIIVVVVVIGCHLIQGPIVKIKRNGCTDASGTIRTTVFDVFILIIVNDTTIVINNTVVIIISIV
jgi:hypothetical protein